MVNQRIPHRELKESILNFVDYQFKKGFPFGELSFIHYKMLNGPDSEEIFDVCAAIEMLILSFDILDDLEDNDSIDSDKPWLDRRDLALNSTTSLLFLSRMVLGETSFPNKEKAVSMLLEYSLNSIIGQHTDLLNTAKTETEYLEMTEKKSGSLVSLACSIGAVLAMKDYPPEIEIYSNYIGIIAQITNDLEDVRSWDRKNDLLNKKYTLPTIYLLNFEDEEANAIRNYYNNQLNVKWVLNNKEKIGRKLVDSGAIIYAKVIKKNYQKKAVAEIQKLNLNQKYVEQLLKYII